MKTKKNEKYFILIFLIFMLISILLGYETGEEISKNFVYFILEMIKIIPCAFILTGLFDVWVKNKTIEKHLGINSKFYGYIYVMILAGTTVGGLYVAFPVAYILLKKGARLSIAFSYLGFASICRVPMTIFEASFLGLKFTLIRLFIAIPLIIIFSIILEKFLKNKNYKIDQFDNE